MDQQTRRELVQIRVDIQALRLLVTEALAMALSYDTRPATTTSLARRAIENLVDELQGSICQDGADPAAIEFNRWFMDAVQGSVISLIDDIEARIEQLKKGRAVH